MFNHNILHENLDVLEFSYKPGILCVCFLLNIVLFSQHLNQSVLRSEESHALPHHALKFGCRWRASVAPGSKNCSNLDLFEVILGTVCMTSVASRDKLYRNITSMNCQKCQSE